MNDNITRNDMKYLYTCILNETTSRSELPDEIFGVPEERKYPLDTKEHVYSAVKLFNHVNKKYEEELADKINKKIKEYNITDINPGPTNRFSKYYNQPVKESVPMSSDPMYLYMQNGNYDYLQKWYNGASTYPIKFGLPSFINENKFNKSIIEAGDKIYHHYWKNRKGFQNKGVGPFVVYGAFTKSKPLKTGMFSPSTTNIDDMVNENVDGLDRISTVVYHYNFSNKDKKYSVLIITSKNTVKAVYLLSRNERSVENEFIKLNLKSIVTESTNIILESPTNVITRQSVIKDGGYYHDGEWNSIIESKGKLYRHRVECLILNSDGDVYLQKLSDGSYRIPGGSTNKGLSDPEQVARECLEEARIVVKNIRKTNKSYVIEQPPKRWMIEKKLPILWDGKYIDIYLADFVRFDKTFKPKEVDYDDMYKYGDFYNKSYLNDIHLSAISANITESTNIILEAPTDVDVDEDDVNDYSDDVEDDTSDEDESDTGNDIGEEDLDDEPNDY